MSDVVIVSAVRTPIGKMLLAMVIMMGLYFWSCFSAGNFLGGLSSLSSYQLGKEVIKEGLSRCAVKPEEVSEVIMGQVRRLYMRLTEK